MESSIATCPIGKGKVVVYRVLAQNAHGGWDSDGARYSSGGQGRTYEVSTCKNGLSLYARDMAVGLPEASKIKVMSTLETLQAEHAGKDLSAVSPWQKHVFAARCYHAMNRGAKTEARLYLSASWLVRDDAVGLFRGLDGPVMARLMIHGGDLELKKSLTPEQRKQVLFNLAKVAHRGGYSTHRDRYLTLAGARDDLVPAEKDLLKKLRWAAAVEPGLQDRAIEAFERALTVEMPDEERASVTYQLADLYRRRGNVVRATELFQQVQGKGDEANVVEGLSTYFLAEMGTGEPWLDPAFQGLAGL